MVEPSTIDPSILLVTVPDTRTDPVAWVGPVEDEQPPTAIARPTAVDVKLLLSE